METAVKSYSLLTCDHDFARALAVSHGIKIANLLGIYASDDTYHNLQAEGHSFSLGTPFHSPRARQGGID